MASAMAKVMTTTLWPVAKTTTTTTPCQHGGSDDVDATMPMANATAKTTVTASIPCQHGGGDDVDATTPMANATAKTTVTVSTPCQYDRGDDVDATTMANAMKTMTMTSSLCARQRDDPMPARH